MTRSSIRHRQARLRRRRRQLAALGLAAAGIALALSAETRAGDPPTRPTVVVELYTSEGCSSCPPAEALLNELGENDPETSTDNTNSRARLILLAWHVDVWDRLGWKDRFADKRYSDQQRSVARTFGTRSIYTPQMLVQGATHFVGSDAARARREIARAARRRLPAKLDAEAAREGDKLTVTVRAKDLAAGRRFQLVITESGLETRVRAGENKGRRLRHDHVVRAMTHKTPAAGAATRLQLAVPDRDGDKTTRRWVLLLRDELGGVIGAVDGALPAKPTDKPAPGTGRANSGAAGKGTGQNKSKSSGKVGEKTQKETTKTDSDSSGAAPTPPSSGAGTD